jgi:hypothetical protein
VEDVCALGRLSLPESPELDDENQGRPRGGHRAFPFIPHVARTRPQEEPRPPALVSIFRGEGDNTSPSTFTTPPCQHCFTCTHSLFPGRWCYLTFGITNRQGAPVGFVAILVGILASVGGLIFGYDTGQISDILLLDDFRLRFASCTDPTDAATCTFSKPRSGAIVGFFSIGTLIGSLAGA